MGQIVTNRDDEACAMRFLHDFVTKVASGQAHILHEVMHPDCRPVLRATGESVVMDLDAFVEALQVIYGDAPAHYRPNPQVELLERDGDCLFFVTKLKNPVGTMVRLRHTLCRHGDSWRIIQSLSILDG